MPNRPKIVCIGAGSAVFGLSNLATIIRSKRLKASQIVLVDIDEQGLQRVATLAHKLNESWDAQMEISHTTDRKEALPGADFVSVSIQVGERARLWELDWEIPLKHGVRQPYAENSGPGGFAHTARNAPLILAIAKDVEDLCPDAWLLNFTNPMIRMTWIVKRYTDVKIVGLCHQLLWAYAMAAAVLSERWELQIPDSFHVHSDYDNLDDIKRIAMAGCKLMDIKAAGLNHFSWVYDIRDKNTGEDLYPLLRERWLSKHYQKFEPLTREMFEIFGLMPTSGDSHLCEYLPWMHDRQTKPWEKYKIKLYDWDSYRRRRVEQEALVEAVIKGEYPVDKLRSTLSEGVPEIIEAVTHNDNSYRQQLNLPNDGLIPNLPKDAVVEVPGIVSGFGINGLKFPPLPEGIAELCRRELAYSSLVIDAAITGDRQLALQALLHDPVIDDIDRARDILDDFLSTYSEYLPQFE